MAIMLSITSVLSFLAILREKNYRFLLLLSIAINSGKYSGVQPLDTILPL